jgi:hypothetical protein
MRPLLTGHTGVLLSIPQNKFRVLKTAFSHRRLAKGNFIAVVSPAVKSAVPTGHSVLVVHERLIGHDIRPLGLPCKLITDGTLENDQVRLDQTVRNAIGIPFEYEPDRTMVSLRPLPGGKRLADRVAVLMRRRYVILRTQKIDIPDMERNFGRCGRSIFDILGCAPGGRLVIEAWPHTADGPLTKRLVINVYEADNDYTERRAALESNDLSSRFINAGAILGIEPDVEMIYLDSHERELLGVTPLDPVLVRADLVDLVSREFTEFGLLFFVALFSLTQVLPIKTTWFTLVLIALGSLTAALIIVVVKLRAR